MIRTISLTLVEPLIKITNLATVYILYSKKVDHFYIGSCIDIEKRLIQHNTHFYKGAYTAIAADWEVFYKFENLDLCLARKIESHIKKMKSKVYLENILKYEDIMKKLIDRYRAL